MHRTCFILTLAALTVALSQCTTTPQPVLDAKTAVVMDGLCHQLASAKNLQVTIKRTASPGFHVGVPVAESASGTILVSRPNRFAARMQTNSGPRTVFFDGSQLTLVDYAAKTHATVKAPGDIDSAVRGVENTYGVTPPVAEFLTNNPRAMLLDGVKSGKAAGTETIRKEACDRLVFTQDDFSWTLWVAMSDHLPRRIVMSYPNGEGGKPLTMTAEILKWKLNGVIPEADLAAAIPAGSRAVEMIPLKQ